eukprot:scaffold20052_cov71-Phaeocystis_antarctica.AAC.3
MLCEMHCEKHLALAGAVQAAFLDEAVVPRTRLVGETTSASHRASHGVPHIDILDVYGFLDQVAVDDQVGKPGC